MSEPRAKPSGKSTGASGQYSKRFFESLKEVRANSNIVLLLLLSMVSAAAIWASSDYVQPILKIAGLPVIYFGIAYALARIVMGLGGEVTHRLEKILSLKQLLLVGFAAIFAAFATYSLASGLVLAAGFFLMTFAEGFNRIILSDEINKGIASKNRTAILSISSLLEGVFTALMAFSFGIAADSFGVQKMFLVALIAFAVITIILYAAGKKIWKK